MKTLDRYVLKSLLESYLICVFLLLSFYIILDLFGNFNKFSQYGDLVEETQKVSLFFIAVEYYKANIPLILYNLCPIITLMSAMFTITKMSKANELTPLKACGISMYRLLYPFIFFAFILSCMMVGLQEKVIPHFAERLEFLTQIQHGRKKSIDATQLSDIYGNIIYIGQYLPLTKELKNIRVIVPDRDKNSKLHAKKIIQASYGEWFREKKQNFLLLKEGMVKIYDDSGVMAAKPEPLPPEGLLLKTDLNHSKVLYPEAKKLDTLSSRDLYRILQQKPDHNAAKVTFYSRFSIPMGNILLLFLGLPLLLMRESKNFFLGTGMCALISACFYGVSIFCLNLGYKEILQPIFSVWFPVVLFGSFGYGLRAIIHT
ncbi:MAG: YjgP/YjgQ family permease [Candidatus Brocadiae bacterium]|nr:YjgP/YjgQ family permease [Candidatus Brocadiia bacterium]